MIRDANRRAAPPSGPAEPPGQTMQDIETKDEPNPIIMTRKVDDQGERPRVRLPRVGFSLVLFVCVCVCVCVSEWV